MNKKLKSFAAVQIAAIGIFSLALTSQSSAATTTTHLLSGGAAIGSPDPKVEASFDGGTWIAATVIPTDNAYSVISGTKWVTGDPSWNGAYFRYRFTLPQITSGSLNVCFFADDAGLVSVNGAPVGAQDPNNAAGNYSGTPTCFASTSLQSGANTLTFSDNNLGGAYGVDFDATLTYTPTTTTTTSTSTTTSTTVPTTTTSTTSTTMPTTTTSTSTTSTSTTSTTMPTTTTTKPTTTTTTKPTTTTTSTTMPAVTTTTQPATTTTTRPPTTTTTSTTVPPTTTTSTTVPPATTTTTTKPTTTSTTKPTTTSTTVPLPTRYCFGKKATIVGNSGSETIYGTDKQDVIYAAGGNDTIILSNVGPTDYVCGGDGDDKIMVKGGKAKVTATAAMT